MRMMRAAMHKFYCLIRTLIYGEEQKALDNLFVQAKDRHDREIDSLASSMDALTSPPKKDHR